MKSQLEQDLLKIFEAGKRCMEDHPDDDSYDTVRFNSALEELSGETKILILEAKKPTEVKDAEKYITECHRDVGFMGSIKYYESKKILDSFYKL